MVAKHKAVLNTTVNQKTREKVIALAKQKGCTMSEALDDLVTLATSGNENEPLILHSNEAVTTEIEQRLESIEVYLKYLCTKINNLPCNFRG